MVIGCHRHIGMGLDDRQPLRESKLAAVALNAFDPRLDLRYPPSHSLWHRRKMLDSFHLQ